MGAFWTIFLAWLAGIASAGLMMYALVRYLEGARWHPDRKQERKDNPRGI